MENTDFDLDIQDERVLIGLGAVSGKKEAFEKSQHIQKEIELCMSEQGYKK